jgi:riboflavin biosynthesis pyrimidine reductase
VYRPRARCRYGALVRQIYPGEAAVTDSELAALYACPEPPPRSAPYLRANMVASLDGAATLTGRSGGLSSEADRQIFAMLRAITDVILVGAGTVRAEGYGPVRPESEGLRWAWLRDGRTPSPPIAVVTRGLDLDTGGPLLTEAPGYARTIVLTTELAPADRRAAAARYADVVIAGETTVDMAAAVSALAQRGHRRILLEGGPHLLSQTEDAGLLDELCLTLSPVLAGPGAGRIVQGAPLPDGTGAKPCVLAHLLAEESYLFGRYTRPS